MKARSYIAILVAFFCLVSGSLRAETRAQEITDAVHALRVLSDGKGRNHPQLLEARTRIQQAFSGEGVREAVQELTAHPPATLLEDLAVIEWRHERDAADAQNIHNRALTVAGLPKLQTELKLGVSGTPPAAGTLGHQVLRHQERQERELFQKFVAVVHEVHELTSQPDVPQRVRVADIKARIAELIAEPAALQAAFENRPDKPPSHFLNELNTIAFRAVEEPEHDTRIRDLLIEVGFHKLAEGVRIAPSDEGNPAGSLYEQLEETKLIMDNALDGRRDENVQARQDLRRRAGHMQRITFIANVLGLGAVFLAVGVNAANWLGFHRNYWRAMGSWTATWAGASFGSFGFWYPMVASPLGRVFLNRSYREFRGTLVDLLKLDPDHAVDYARKLAMSPYGWPYSAQQNLALEALFQVKDPRVTQALMDMATRAIDSENYSLAKRLLREIEERERTEITPPGTRRKFRQYTYSERGTLARDILQTVETYEAIPKTKLRSQLNYLLTNPVARRRALILLGGLAGTAAWFTSNHNLILALVSGVAGSLGLSQLRTMLGNLLLGNSDNFLHERTRSPREAFTARAKEMLKNAVHLSPDEQARLRKFAERGDLSEQDRNETADKTFDAKLKKDCRDAWGRVAGS